MKEKKTTNFFPRKKKLISKPSPTEDSGVITLAESFSNVQVKSQEPGKKKKFPEMFSDVHVESQELVNPTKKKSLEKLEILSRMEKHNDNYHLKSSPVTLFEKYVTNIRGIPCLTLLEFEVVMIALKWKVPETPSFKVKELFHRLSHSTMHGTRYLVKEDLENTPAKLWELYKAWLNPKFDATPNNNNHPELKGVIMPRLDPQSLPWVLLVFGATDSHDRIRKCLQDSKIARWEDFVILSESNLGSKSLWVGLDFCLQNKQNILLFSSSDDEISDSVKILVNRVNQHRTRVGVLLVSHLLEPSTRKKQKSHKKTSLNDGLDCMLFQMNSDKSVDLVAWITVSNKENDESVPKISRILGQLPNNDQEFLHRSLGALLVMEEQQATQTIREEETFVQKTSLTSQICLVLNDKISPSVNSFHIAPEESVLLTHYSPKEGDHLSVINTEEDVKNVEAILKGRMNFKREDIPQQFEQSLKQCFCWVISSHGNISVGNSSPKAFALNNQIYLEDELVKMCTRVSKGHGKGKLQIVFLNACGEMKSNLAERLSKVANIPFVVYWKTKCLSEVCPIILKVFFQVFVDHYLSRKNTTFCVQDAFERAKDFVTKIYHEDKDGQLNHVRKYRFSHETNVKSSYVDFEVEDVGEIDLIMNGYEAAPNQLFKVYPKLSSLSCSTSTPSLGELNMSPLSEITLEGISREQAMIVTGARSFAYCHPPSRELLEELKDLKGMNLQELKDFGEMGGFAYFCPDQKVLQINVRCRTKPPYGGGGMLKLSKHKYPVSDEFVVVLRTSGRLVQVPSSSKEVKFLGWLLPGEEVVVGAPKFDNGAFVTFMEGHQAYAQAVV